MTQPQLSTPLTLMLTLTVSHMTHFNLVENHLGAVTDDDPLLTDLPYPWWETPERFSTLGHDDKMTLLRAGKMNERGKSLA